MSAEVAESTEGEASGEPAAEEASPPAEAAPDESSAAAETEEKAPPRRRFQPSSEARVREKERDVLLVARVKEGDVQAFRELFEHYRRRVYAIAYGVVGNEQDAIDVVQEAFIKVHKHVARFEGTSSFYTWLYRIVMNLSIDHIRKHRRVRKIDYDDTYKRPAEQIAGDGAILPRILGENPGKAVMRSELADHLQAALDQLPEYHRAVLLLREVEGLSYEEMAEALEVPKGTIMSRLFHARRKMQELLAPYLDGDLDLGH